MIISKNKALVACISLSIYSSTGLSAQLISIPHQRPVDDRLQLMKSSDRPLGFELPAITQSVVSRKPLTGESGVDQASGSEVNAYTASVFISKVEFTGYSVVKVADLNELVKRYIGTRLTQKDLSEIRNNITSYYVELGYINSGAYMPDQDLTDSVLKINIVEGKLSSIDVSTSGELSEGHIKSKLAISKDDILDINYIKNQLYQFQQDPLIDKINASLTPSEQRGLADLFIEVTEKNPLFVDVLLNNYRPPSVGELQGIISTRHLNLSGEGDSGFLSVSKTEGLSSFDVAYEYPVIPGVFSLGFGAQLNDSQVIEEPFNLIDIENRSSSWSIHARYNVYKTLNGEFNLIFTLESKSSKTTIEDTSFNLNDVNADKTQASIFRFAQEWTSHSISSAYIVRSTFSVGLDTNDATILDNNAPDAEYIAWLGQFQWLVNIVQNQSASVQLIAQFSDDALLPFEQYASGGRYSVRGFRENAFIRDIGVTLNLDYRILHKFDVFDFPVGFIIFSDLSALKNKERVLDSKETMASIGLGVQGNLSNSVNYELMWAHAPERKDVNENNALQDDGIHFQLAMHF